MWVGKPIDNHDGTYLGRVFEAIPWDMFSINCCWSWVEKGVWHTCIPDNGLGDINAHKGVSVHLDLLRLRFPQYQLACKKTRQ